MKTGIALVLMMLSFPSFGLTNQDVNRWKEDIDFYSSELTRRHIDPFHSLAKEDFEREIEAIKSSLPQATTNEIFVKLMKLTHSINDGHTSFPLWSWKFHSFPFELRMFGRDLYVVKTTSANDDLLGAKLISVNGFSSAEVVRRFSTLTPFSENEFSTAVRVAEFLPKAEILNGLDLINDTTKASFLFEINGKTKQYQFNSAQRHSLDRYITYNNNNFFSYKEKINEDLWFGASSDSRVIYIKFRRYTSMSKMEGLAEDVLSFINKNKSKNLIIDMRDNYGGDFFVGLKLAQWLLADSIDWKSGVYVLIDNVTFSAAMSNAAQFSQILNATLVGTPTGAKPSGYQDMGQFTLPNSGLDVTYSKRLYHFKEDQKDALYPDVQVEISIQDYRDGNDRQLLWVLKDIEIKRNGKKQGE